MNVAITDVSPNFSLLECNADTDRIHNKNIFDVVAFANTVSNVVLATDKFVRAEDPFYQLDDGLNLAKDYKKQKSDTTKELKVESDPSFILSNMTILNQSPNYFGKNKYF